jgi:hypothetical protein
MGSVRSPQPPNTPSSPQAPPFPVSGAPGLQTNNGETCVSNPLVVALSRLSHRSAKVSAGAVALPSNIGKAAEGKENLAPSPHRSSETFTFSSADLFNECLLPTRLLLVVLLQVDSCEGPSVPWVAVRGAWRSPCTWLVTGLAALPRRTAF